MLRKCLVVVGLIILALVPVVSAQEDVSEDKPEQGWGLFGGFLGGDIATELEQDGFQAELDDGFVVGAMYFTRMSERTRFEARLNYSPGTMLNTENGDVDGQLIWFDVALIPGFKLGEKTSIGVPFGIGWAAFYDDDNFLEQVFGRPVGTSQSGGSGMMYFLGLQLNVQTGDSWEFFAEVRAQRFHRLVDIRERNVKTTQGVLGFRRLF